MWLPNEDQLEWTRNLIRAIRDGGTWVTPAMGVFIVDKRHHVLRLIEKYDHCDEEMLRRTKITFGLLDWTVEDDNESPPPPPSRGRYVGPN